MTDPTPTRAEVARYTAAGYDPGMKASHEGAWVSFTDYQALRERAEAAEAECACDAIAGLRTREMYLAMIDAGQTNALEELDFARQQVRRHLRAASPAQEGGPLDVTTRVVLDRAERIVAGQSQQERRIAEIFLRPTENSHD